MLQIDLKSAKALYPAASAEFKTMLEKEFGDELTKTDIIDLTPTVEAALAIAGKLL